MPKTIKLKISNLAYIAGYFDGEGCITLDSRPRQATLRTVIVSSDYESLCVFSETIGGMVRPINHGNAKRFKPVFRWCLYGIKAQDFLKQISPYLRAKRRQAKLALSIVINSTGVKLSTKDKQHRIYVTKEISRMNKQQVIMETV